MRWTSVLFGALLLVPLASADEPAPESRVFVEVASSHEACYVGEPLRLTIRVGIDREWFAQNAVPLFRQEVDVPVHVKAPWLDAVAGAMALDPGDTATAVQTLAVNDGVTKARALEDREYRGRTYAVVGVERRYLPQTAGSLELSAPAVRFAFATQFEEDFVGGRVGLDPQDVRVEGRPTTIEVRALPDGGRPPSFGGAVGRYTVAALVDPADGETETLLRLSLTIVGSGNLTAIDVPRLDLEGFHVYGTIDEHGRGHRTLIYEIAPTSDVVFEVPAIPFAFFDPTEAAYRIVHTEPVPFRDPPEAPVAPGPGPAAGTGARDPQSADDGPLAVLWLALVLAVFVTVVVFALRGRRVQAAASPEPGDDGRDRIEAASLALRDALAEPGPDLADALAEFLAAGLRVPRAAVIAPDLAERLESAGAPPDVAAHAASTLEQLVAARYGGTHEAPTVDVGLIDDMERAFRT